MYFHRPTSDDGALVSKITSRVAGASTAKRLVEVSAVSGAGAIASSKALVSVKVPSRLTKTTTLRFEFFFFTSVYPPSERPILGHRVSDNTTRGPYVHIIDTVGGGLARNFDFSLKWAPGAAQTERTAQTARFDNQ